MSEITRILQSLEQGDARGAAELLPLVYDELRQLAARKMAQESPGHTLQPTALVHEAWLRVVGTEDVKWNGRAHFFGAAAEAMRRILIDSARRKRALRHGGGQVKLEIDGLELAAVAQDENVLDLNAALEKLTARDPKKAELVKLRYFVGLTMEEAAEILGVSVATANRWWTYSRAWLYQEMEPQDEA